MCSVKELANYFEEKFECLGGKYSTFRKLFPFCSKKKLQKLVRMLMEELRLYLTK